MNAYWLNKETWLYIHMITGMMSSERPNCSQVHTHWHYHVIESSKDIQVSINLVSNQYARLFYVIDEHETS